MTREEIKNTPELVDFMLDTCVLADSRAKVRKRLEEVCDMAIKALEQKDVLEKIKDEINSPNRGTCDYFIVDRIEEIINKYKTESEE